MSHRHVAFDGVLAIYIDAGLDETRATVVTVNRAVRLDFMAKAGQGHGDMVESSAVTGTDAHTILELSFDSLARQRRDRKMTTLLLDDIGTI
jgi:hypothetical protein